MSAMGPPKTGFGTSPDTIVNGIRMESYFHFSSEGSSKTINNIPEPSRSIADPRAFSRTSVQYLIRKQKQHIFDLVASVPSGLESLNDTVKDPLECLPSRRQTLPRSTVAPLTPTHNRWEIPWIPPNINVISVLNFKNENLQNEVERKATIIEKLAAEVTSLRSDLHKVQIANKHLTFKFQSLMTASQGRKISAQKIPMKQVSETLAAAEARALNAEIMVAEIEEKATQKAKNETQRAQKLQQDLEEQKHRNGKLSRELQATQQQMNLVIVRSNAFEEKLKDSERQAQRRVDEVTKSYEAALSQSLDLQKKLSLIKGTLRAQKGALQEEEAKVMQTNHLAATQRVEYEEQIEQVNVAMQKCKSEQQAELKDIRKLLEKANEKELSAHNIIQKLEMDLQALELTRSQVTMVTSQLSALREETNTLQHKLQMEEKRRFETETALEVARKEVQRHNEFSQAAEKQVNVSTLQLKNLQTRIKEIEQTKMSEIKELTQELQKLQTKNKNLEEGSKKLETDLSSFTELKIKYDELQQKVTAHVEESTRLSKERGSVIKEKDAEIRSLKTRLEGLATVEEKMKLEVKHAERLETERILLENQLKDLKTDKEKLLADAKTSGERNKKEMEKRNSDIESLRNEIKRLKGDETNNKLNQELEEVRRKLMEYENADVEFDDKSWFAKLGDTIMLRPENKAPEDIQKAYEEGEEKFKKAAGIIGSQRKKIKELTAEVDSLKQGKRSGWFDQLNPLKTTSEATQREQELQENITQLTKALEDAKQMQEVWEAPIIEAFEKEGKVLDEIDDAEIEIEERYETIKSRFETLKVLYAKLRLTGDATVQNKNNLEEISKAGEAARSELAALREDLNKMKKELAEVISQRDSINNLLRNVTKAKEVLEGKLQEVENINEEEKMLRKARDDLEEKLKQAKERIQNLVAEVQSKEKERNGFETEVVHLKETVFELQNKTNLEISDLTHLESEKTQLQTTINTLSDQIVQMKNLAEESGKIIDDQRNEIEKILTEKNIAEEENRRLQEVLEKKKGEIYDSEEEILRRKLQQAEENVAITEREAIKQMNQAVDNANTSRERINQLEDKIQRFEGIEQELIKQVEVYRNFVQLKEATDAKFAKAELQVKEMEQQKDELLSNLKTAQERLAILEKKELEIEELKLQKTELEKKVQSVTKESEKLRGRLEAIAEKVKQKKAKKEIQESRRESEESELPSPTGKKKKKHKKEKDETLKLEFADVPSPEEPNEPSTTLTQTAGSGGLFSVFGMGGETSTTTEAPGLFSAFGLGGVEATTTSLMGEAPDLLNTFGFGAKAEEDTEKKEDVAKTAEASKWSLW